MSYSLTGPVPFGCANNERFAISEYPKGYIKDTVCAVCVPVESLTCLCKGLMVSLQHSFVIPFFNTVYIMQMYIKELHSYYRLYSVNDLLNEAKV